MAVDKLNRIGRDLLRWYDANARSLPWRALPGEPRKPAYHVWLSEIMLQQTTVTAVKPYFEKFTTTWPTVADLAAADSADVMAAWAGLGYYARARNLVACAQVIMENHSGAFPQTEEALRTLPGIGAYTSAAIAAIAFDQPAVAVDANVERVVARLFAVDTLLPAARPQLATLAASITPMDRAGDFAQAMMDLGSSLCRARNAACLACPLAEDCAANAAGDPLAYPVKAAKSAKPEKKGTAYWIVCDGDVLLVRRPPKAMLGGMRALPTGPWTLDDPALAEAPIEADWQEAGTVHHVFTHFALDLRVMVATVASRDFVPLDGEWWPCAAIEQAGLPTLFARAAERAQASA